MTSKNKSSLPKRVKIFFSKGFQLRYIALVSGSLMVLLLFAGLHGIFAHSSAMDPAIFEQVKPALVDSTIRLFIVGFLYIAVVSLAAIFLSHKSVGPTERLESEINELAHQKGKPKPLHIREGDELEGLVTAINNLIRKGKR